MLRENYVAQKINKSLLGKQTGEREIQIAKLCNHEKSSKLENEKESQWEGYTKKMHLRKFNMMLSNHKLMQPTTEREKLISGFICIEIYIKPDASFYGFSFDICKARVIYARFKANGRVSFIIDKIT